MGYNYWKFEIDSNGGVTADSRGHYNLAKYGAIPMQKPHCKKIIKQQKLPYTLIIGLYSSITTSICKAYKIK